MHFRLTAESIDLVEPSDVTSFSVTCPVDLQGAQLAARVRDTGLGELSPDDAHVMVPVDLIRRMAQARVGPDWNTDLLNMIDYAASKGWTDADRTRIRAHIEHSQPSEGSTSGSQL